MGRIVLWIQILYVCFIPGSGLKCLSCQSVEYLDECFNNMTCTEGDVCFVLQTSGIIAHSYSLGCMPRPNCSQKPFLYGGPWMSQTLTCCDNGDLCVLKLPAFVAATYPPKVTHLDPPFIWVNTSMTFQSSGIIICKNNASRSVSTTWLFNGGTNFPPHASTPGGFLLYINGMTSSEVGNYTCVISKDGMTAQTTWRITLLEEKPHISSLKTSISQRPNINDLVRITCTITGYPVPTILWSFRDPMGVNYIPEDVSYPTSSTVLIQQFQPMLHSGTWTCMARNSLGAAQMSIEL